jgi:His-Xaa-Ser system protein HxsD
MTPGLRITTLMDGTWQVEFSLTVYRLSAVQKAAYNYSGKFNCNIDQSDNTIKVFLLAKNATFDPDAAVADFCTEVLDQHLREIVAEETEGIRNLLLAQAFSRTSLIGNSDSD